MSSAPGTSGWSWGRASPRTGNDVVCVDKDEEKVAGLERGEIPIYEPGLAELVPRNVSGEERAALHDRPRRGGAGLRGDLHRRRHARRTRTAPPTCRACSPSREDIARNLDGWRVIVLKSTVPVGTAAQGASRHVARSPSTPSRIVSNPEFLKEGTAVDDFLRPDRVVIGTDDPTVEATMRQALRALRAHGQPDPRHGPRLGGAHEVRRQRHARDAHLVHERDRAAAATGWAPTSTSCASASAATRASARRSSSRASGYGGSLLPEGHQGARPHGARRPGCELHVVAGVEQHQRGAEEPPRAPDRGAPRRPRRARSIAIWGLAFKPRTDDMREAPALVDHRGAAGGRARRCGPTTRRPRSEARRLFGDRITLCQRAYEAVEGRRRARRGHRVERVPGARLRARCGRSCATPAIFDGRNIYDPKMMRSLGFHYEGIGRR